MILSFGIAVAALAVLAFGGKLCAVYLSALESIGVPKNIREFYKIIFPALRWIFAPAALIFAAISFFVR